jgi:hypothetical protein
MKASEFVTEATATKTRLDPKCWTGKKIGSPKTKVKGGVRVNNCVPAESVELEEEFDLIESIIDDLAERNGVDAEMIWEDLESLSDDELYVFAVTQPIMEDWQKANKKDKTDGMSQKAVNAYRREHPGSKLKTAVTTKPSKLKKGGKASKRRSSYCSRSKGQMNMHNISCAKTPNPTQPMRVRHSLPLLAASALLCSAPLTHSTSVARDTPTGACSPTTKAAVSSGPLGITRAEVGKPAPK